MNPKPIESFRQIVSMLPIAVCPHSLHISMRNDINALAGAGAGAAAADGSFFYLFSSILYL